MFKRSVAVCTNNFALYIHFHQYFFYVFFLLFCFCRLFYYFYYTFFNFPNVYLFRYIEYMKKRKFQRLILVEHFKPCNCWYFYLFLEKKNILKINVIIMIEFFYQIKICQCVPHSVFIR